MTSNKSLAAKIFNIKIKWMRKLTQKDQQYLESRLTMKHLSLFHLNACRKRREYQNQIDLEKDIAIYLMMIMVMNSVSDEQILLNEFKKYSHVPTYLLKLAEGVNPYRMVLDIFNISQRIGTKLQLPELYNKALATQEEKLKKEIPREDYDMFGEIIDYYALEILGFALIEKQTVHQFNYELELASIFRFINEKYYKKSPGKSEDEQKYHRIMSEFAEKKAA